MEQLEKVCKGLECCVLRDPDDHRRCGECPYNPHAISNEPCANGLKFNALTLIRQQQERIRELEAAQSARVMTLEDLKNADDCPCWFESHGTYMGEEGFWIIPYMFTAWNTMKYVFPLMQINERGDTHFSELGLPAYNKAWRCWTQRPTDKQREAVKWE